MSKYGRIMILVIALAIAAGIIAWKIPFTRGLDIAGGIRVVLQVDPQRPSDWPKKVDEQMSKMDTIRRTIQKRVMGFQGVTEPRVVIQDTDKVVVELPGVKNPDEALRKIKSTASLEFYYLQDVAGKNNQMAPWRMNKADEDSYDFIGPKGEVINSKKDPKAVLEKVVKADKNPPILTGAMLLPNAEANYDQTNSQIVVHIEFNKEGTKIFREWTRVHVGDYLAIFFDGKLLTAPVINEPIPNGQAVISGGFKSYKEATELADYLNAGALPVPLKVIAKDSVEPTLGKETISQVIVAGIAGLALVVLFMLVYYRLPGMLANIALCLYALYTISVFKAIHATMTLAGFAALIISIGMAVDANILIFERLKEELKGGKTLRAAIDAGFARAFTAIFDSNMCTAITCAILMWMGTPAVKSFAFTLLVGVAISMFTAITVTRTMLHLLVGWEWAQKPSLYGLGTSWFAKKGFTLDIIGKRAYYFILSAIIIVPGLVVLATSGLKPGIEFKSGTTFQVTFKRPVRLAEVRSVVEKYAKGSEVQLARAGVGTGPKTRAFIKTDLLSDSKEYDYNEKLDSIRQELDEKIGIKTRDDQGRPAFDTVNTVGPTISEELTRNAFWAVIIASIAIVLYLTVRFAIGGLAAGFKYGVCAVIALIHDSAFILGMFAVLGKVAGWEVDSMFVTAVLTVIGFSVHDTIVVFDRIRENLKHRLRGESFEQLSNRSILQTFSRSINTTLTVVLTLAMLIMFGGPLLRQFYVALLAGIIVGTYSSIFIATPLVVIWDRFASRTPVKKAFESKPLVEKPMVSPSETEEASDEMASDIEAGAADAVKSKAKRKRTNKRRF